ncbi:Ig-like domain-containing protein [Namhaeicola litoreus]|uniref:Ig-like domain-containing protein n=1 Tax=Namhaeicola litoreus TaxID=1052145 RepID=A0ABW3XXA2_9FLAO
MNCTRNSLWHSGRELLFNENLRQYAILFSTLSIFLIFGQSVLANRSGLNEVILTLRTTSKSKEWKPSLVTKTGDLLTWKATAPGMVEQIQLGNNPVFDLSVVRNSSEVLIEVSSTDESSLLTELKINSLNITEINLIKCEGMEVLSISDNQLKTLNIEENIALRELYCNFNQLSQLEFGNNINLVLLSCFSNQIQDLSFEFNTNLESLSCSRNLLSALDLSRNTKLNSLECDDNLLQNLNIRNGHNDLLQKLKTTGNSELFCIQVDSQDEAEVKWTDIDPWTKFNNDCTFTNENPVAEPDFYETEDGVKLIVSQDLGLLQNDIDPDGDILAVELVRTANHGELNLFTDGTFNYQPDRLFFGVDSFTYYATDGELSSDEIEVEIMVNLVNTPPIANEDNYETEEGVVLNISNQDGLLLNDSDQDMDPMVVSLLENVQNGSLVLNPDGSFVYTPNALFSGTDNFTYSISDGFVHSETAQVNILVKGQAKLVLPTAFSPNGDGINDFFKPVYRGMSFLQLQVFDTWGNLIYDEQNEVLQGWNGLIKGKDAQNGNYMYRIKAVSLENEKTEKEGLFTLIK